MTLEELETKLVQANVIPAAAKMISLMALTPNIERHEKSWAIPLGLVIVSSSIRPDRQAQQRRESLESIMKSVIKDQRGKIYSEFSIVTELTIAPGNAYLSYCFNPEFIRWADLTNDASAKLH